MAAYLLTKRLPSAHAFDRFAEMGKTPKYFVRKIIQWIMWTFSRKRLLLVENVAHWDQLHIITVHNLMKCNTILLLNIFLHTVGKIL